MAWLRVGDTSAMHPIVLRVIDSPHFDARLLNEVFGFVSRCAVMSGQHTTDYVVSRGTAYTMAGADRFEILIDVAMFCGYMTAVDGPTGPSYAIVENADFMHLRLKEEIEWEQERRRNNANPANTIPVRLRDGDGCRWCGRIVDWESRKAARSGTYDHLDAKQSGTAETMVVCCNGCNSSRKDGAYPKGITQLLPVPVDPYYSQKTVDWLEGNDWRKRNGLPVPRRARKVRQPGDMAPGITTTGAAAETATTNTQLEVSTRTEDRPGTQPGNAHPNPDGSAADLGHPSRVGTASTVQRTDHSSVHAPLSAAIREPLGERPDAGPTSANASPAEIEQKSADPANSQGSGSTQPGRVGTGRVGSGRVGGPSLSNPPPTQQDSQYSSDPPTSRRRPRSRRSRRRNPS